MRYKLTKDDSTVFDTTNNIIIPRDSRHPLYQDFLKWLDDGNIPDPFDPPTQEERDIAAAKAHVKLNALKNMTPAQIQAWVAANVTNLAQAQDAIATLAVGVGILARRI